MRLTRGEACQSERKRSESRALKLAWLMRELNHAAYAIIDLSPHEQNRVVLHPAEDGR